MELPSIRALFKRTQVDRYRFTLLVMLGSSIGAFFFRFPFDLDRLLLQAGTTYFPASFVEILIKASLLGLILTIIVTDFNERILLPTAEDIAPLPYFGQLSTTGRLQRTFVAVLAAPISRLQNILPSLRADLLKSNLNISPEAFLGIVLFATFVTLPISIVGIVFFILIRNLFFLILIPIPLFVFLAGLRAPKVSQSTRSGALGQELPYMVGYFNILASGGISPVVALRKIASAMRIFPAAANEARRILLDLDVFGSDPLSTFDKVARFNPNRVFSDFFAGYSVTIRIGGDIASYIDVKMKDIFARGERAIRSSVNIIGSMAEAYISVSVILGIVLFVLFALASVTGQPGGGIDPSATQNSILFSAVFVPMVSVMIMYLVHATLAKEPHRYNRPYIVFAASTIAIPIMFLIPFEMPPPLRLGVALIIPTIPAAFLATREAIHKKGVESMLPSFVADLTEVRKTGLSPEKGIEQLAGRNYAHLSKYVRAMSAQLSWGVPLDRVLANFTLGVRSWTVRAVAFLLLQVVEVGGGTVRMFVNLTDFTQKVWDLEKERRSMLRPYIFIPYFGAIMLVASALMMLSLLSQPIGPTQPQMSRETVAIVADTLFSGAIVQSFFMGMVAGKMGEGSVAAGFKHAGAMVAASLFTIYGMQFFMPNLI